MKKYIVLALLIASCACAQIMPGIMDSQRNLPGWLSDPNFVAPVFNGVNGYAKYTYSPGSGLPVGSASRTLMTWVKIYAKKGSATINYPFFNFGANTGTGRVGVGFTDTRLAFGLGGNNFLYANFDYGVTWHHVAMSMAENCPVASIACFIDGTRVSTAVFAGATETSAIPTSGELVFCNYAGGPGAAWYTNTEIAEASIWNRCLSASEIAYYYPKRLSGKEPGIVALYHMNDGVNVASQTLIDSVGGKHATMYNSVPWTARRGYEANASDVRSAQYALSFDGSNDVASGANAAITGYPYTLEGWMFTPALAAGSESILISIASSSLASGTYCGAINKATVYNQMAGRDTTRLDVASSTFAKWVHVAMVASASNLMLLYQNGVQIGTDTTDKPFLPNFDKLSIGAIRAATTIYRPGSFADVRIWNTARTAAQIRDNMYQVQTGSETGLVYYWRINEGTGTTLNNLGSAGAAGNLTLIGGPTWIGRSIP